MILVKAIDCFLYGYTMVNTGNKVHVEEKDIPKLIRAGKIGPENMPEVTEEAGVRIPVQEEEPEANRDSMGYRLDKYDVDELGRRYPASKRKSKRKK